MEAVEGFNLALKSSALSINQSLPLRQSEMSDLSYPPHGRGAGPRPARTIAAVLKAAKAAGAASVTLSDGTIVRFVDDAPPTADNRSLADEWANAKPR
jgi:hypothetical protein